MHIRKIAITLVVGLALALPVGAFAQGSSINTFSPYTFYGIGDLATQGPAYLKSMGGTGVAFRSPMMVNYLNPAANSATGQKSFLFNFGLAGNNSYLKTSDKNTSFNTFNVSNVAIQFPLAKKIGFSVSMSPYSMVGYKIEKIETDKNIIANLGQVRYQYDGEGGISQFKAGIGMQVIKNLSLGVEMVYYMGSINRNYGVYITPIITTGAYNNMTASNTEHVSKIFANFGVQWDAIRTDKRLLTIGATFQPGGKLNAKTTNFIPSNNIYQDTVNLSSFTSDYKLPTNLTLGAFYHTPKMSVGLDYSFQNWGAQNIQDQISQGQEFTVSATNTHSIKVGGQWTPNRGDIRHFYNRLTYRAGLRYNNYYQQFNGHNIDDKAVTVGVGIPINMMGRSSINVGLEVGNRGTTKYQLIKERYVKLSIGLSLFGEDLWFMKYKYE